MVDIEVVGHVALGRGSGLQDDRQLARLVLHFDHVVVLGAERGDGDAPAIDLDMAVIDQLACREDGRRELGAIDDGVEPALEQADQMLAGVTLAPPRLLIDAAELALTDIAVVALEALLGEQLQTVFRGLLAPLTMLAGAVFALVDRALGAAPEIDVEAAIDLVLRLLSLGHARSFFDINMLSRSEEHTSELQS